MVAIQLMKGETFDPDKTFQWFMTQQEEGGMDPKWMPDYIRVVDTLPLTNTQKIPVKPFKKQNFNIKEHPDMEIFFRKRGDTTYNRLTPDNFKEIEQCFAESNRESLLKVG
jgi:hypothetical protein